MRRHTFPIRAIAACLGCAILWTWANHAAAVTQLTVTDAAVKAFSAATLEDDPRMLPGWDPDDLAAGGRAVVVWIPEDGAAAGREIMGAYYAEYYERWFGPRPMVRGVGAVEDLQLVGRAEDDALFLFTIERRDGESGPQAVYVRRSDNFGSTWTEPEQVLQSPNRVELGTTAVASDGAVLAGMLEHTPQGPSLLHMARGGDGPRWRVQTVEGTPEEPLSPPVLVATDDGGLAAYFTPASYANRYFRVRSVDGAQWGAAEAVNLPSAVDANAPRRTASILRVEDRFVAAANEHVLRPDQLTILNSYDGGRMWPERRTIDGAAPDAEPVLLEAVAGGFHLIYARQEGGVGHYRFADGWAAEPYRLAQRPNLANVVPPLDNPFDYHRSTPSDETPDPLPMADDPFVEHMRGEATEADWPAERNGLAGELPGVGAPIATPVVAQAGREWVGTEDGLYCRADGGAADFERHPAYGVDGPRSNIITGLAADSRDNLWIATPAGLSVRDRDGAWRNVTGRDGLPWEELTGIDVDGNDRVWLGSSRGVILHEPYADGGQWCYRAGPRYLPDDHVLDLAFNPDRKALIVRTEEGYSLIEEVSMTLYEQTEYLEERFNERHRRLGLPSPAIFPDPANEDEWVHTPQPSDGLWAGYHVTGMSLAFSDTLEDRYRESARMSVEAQYLLQTVTGIEGLVARSMVSVDEPAARDVEEQDNWHHTADGLYLWRDDVSSDQISGHFLGFFSYFEHIAQFDPAERERIERQIRPVMDYLLDNNYTLPDWNGVRTLWSWWNPELVNDAPAHYLESGLYSLMILSFLQVTYYVTEDPKYLDYYEMFIEEHDYLSNVLLQKTLYPDETNHSDDQLSAVAFYPIIQLVYDPCVREALHKSVRRHAYIESEERNSFFAFVYAVIDPDDAAVGDGLRTLREVPRDRRTWSMLNSHRADVVIRPDTNRWGENALLEVLPYDEHHFERWNQDPYRADFRGAGNSIGSGEHFILPYWMARYHGLIAPPGE